jgi:hypothetical protein
MSLPFQLVFPVSEYLRWLLQVVLPCIDYLLLVTNRQQYARLSTVDLLVLTSLDQLHFIFKIFFSLCYKTNYLHEEVNCTETSSSVSVPWIRIT